MSLLINGMCERNITKIFSNPDWHPRFRVRHGEQFFSGRARLGCTLAKCISAAFLLTTEALRWGNRCSPAWNVNITRILHCAKCEQIVKNVYYLPLCYTRLTTLTHVFLYSQTNTLSNMGVESTNRKSIKTSK